MKAKIPKSRNPFAVHTFQKNRKSGGFHKNRGKRKQQVPRGNTKHKGKCHE